MLGDTTYQEKELLAKTAGGDEQAFALLVKQHAPQLYTYIYALTRCEQDAQDVVQEVFVDIWLARHSLTEVRNFGAFLKIISRNKAISAMRKMIRERARREQWQLTEQEEAPDHKEAGLRLIDEAILQLAPQQQKIWILTKKQDKSYQEVADLLGISRETVKKHLQYANAAIFKYVGERLPAIIVAYVLSR